MNQLHGERDLLSRIASGDEEAFSQFFYHYGAIINAVIIKIVKDENATEDIVSEVFLKLWIMRASLPGLENPSGWLYRMATNLSINHLRRNKQEAVVLKKIYMDLPSIENDVDDGFSLKELKLAIKSAVATLSPLRKRIYELSREQGLNRQEIAALLQISENTVKNQLRLSLQHIQRYILTKYGILLCTLFFL